MKFAVAMLCLVLCACHNRTCLESHPETQFTVTPVLVGMTNNVPQYIYLPQFYVVDVCDKYEEEKTQ